jgi:hypothetical protein
LEGPFDVELSEGSRLAAVIDRIENDTCTRDDLRDLGTELWTGLIADDRGTAVYESIAVNDALLQISLSLPPELEPVPWECLYDGMRFLAAEPGWSVIRDPLTGRAPTRRASAVKPELRLLAVVPEGAGLRVEEELRNLKLAVKQVENLQISDLRGRVTPQKILDGLAQNSPDIFHFVGHGTLDSAGNVTIRLNSEDSAQSEFWVQADQFALILARHPIQLAVFNCCYGGYSTRTSISGLGPLLLQRNIPAIVAMRYPVVDQVALRFSEAFYGALLRGENSGRVDVALQHARYKLCLNATTDQWRSFITPVLYLARHTEKLFEIMPRPVANIERRLDFEDVSIPNELVEALSRRRCVPIVGSALTRPLEDRLSIAPFTLQALTEHLSQKCAARDYSILLEAAERAGLTEMAFQSISEVFVCEQRRYRLIDTIRNWYENSTPHPSHLALATWPVPAIFYTHFDGLLEAAFAREGRTPRVVYALANPPDLQQNHQVLVLVRGTLTNDESIVLTEQENEELSATIDRLHPSIEQITTAVTGRSVLLLGVNPRDPIVRKLARRLIRPRGNQGPAYFVCPNFTACDKAYWASV